MLFSATNETSGLVVRAESSTICTKIPTYLRGAVSVPFSLQFLILATDGVWDVTEIGQAVQIVQVRAKRTHGMSS